MRGGTTVSEARTERTGVPNVLSASTISSDSVRNPQGDDLGKIEDLMIDMDQGCIAYVVLSFGGFLGLGDKLFAIPWQALQIAPHEHKFVLDVPKERLESAPGFDKDNWPDAANWEWLRAVHSHYGYEPYWVRRQSER
jgi:sporulation protein YlmC with PRC-barrel domain